MYMGISIWKLSFSFQQGFIELTLECTVDGALSQIPTLHANVGNRQVKQLSHILPMKGSHVASLVKFHQVV